MAKTIGRNQNRTDEALVLDAIPLNSTTTTTLLPANNLRIAVHVNNNSSNRGVWIKLQAADVDDDKKGIWLPPRRDGSSSWDMTPDNIYTGEISAIADVGTPDVYITEY